MCFSYYQSRSLMSAHFARSPSVDFFSMALICTVPPPCFVCDTRTAFCCHTVKGCRSVLNMSLPRFWLVSLLHCIVNNPCRLLRDPVRRRRPRRHRHDLGEGCTGTVKAGDLHSDGWGAPLQPSTPAAPSAPGSPMMLGLPGALCAASVTAV